MATILKKTESARGCGYRKKGGLYLVSGGLGSPCGKLPAPLDVCPCCGSGIKFTRGFTWISSALFKDLKCRSEYPARSVETCFFCPFSDPGAGRMGLLWVGERYYKTALDFSREADRLGVSKRIARVPHEFKIGETWIALAHIKAIRRDPSTDRLPELFEGEPGPPEITFSPGVFRAFRPSAIEYIVTGKESEEELDALEERGFTLVDVTRDIDTQRGFFESEDEAEQRAFNREAGYE